MLFFPPRLVARTALHFPQSVIELLGCGLFRCPLPKAYELMPELSALYDSAPVKNPEEWELDLKIHMLMKDQYPCIPNWHCDNVPRDGAGVRYDKIDRTAPDMLLWVSHGPLTEFLQNPLHVDSVPTGHLELANAIKGAPTQSIEPEAWTAMDQRTPHRGTLAAEDGWRIFARLTHKSITPVRPVLSHIRRHCQVYLDATSFEW